MYREQYGEYTIYTQEYTVNLLFIACKQLISISFENFCIPVFKEKHLNLKEKLPAKGFSTVSVSKHQILVTFFLLHLKAQEYFNH